MGALLKATKKFVGEAFRNCLSLISKYSIPGREEFKRMCWWSYMHLYLCESPTDWPQDANFSLRSRWRCCENNLGIIIAPLIWLSLMLTNAIDFKKPTCYIFSYAFYTTGWRKYEIWTTTWFACACYHFWDWPPAVKHGSNNQDKYDHRWCSANDPSE